jgi:hypothetical protein
MGNDGVKEVKGMMDRHFTIIKENFEVLKHHGRSDTARIE